MSVSPERILELIRVVQKNNQQINNLIDSVSEKTSEIESLQNKSLELDGLLQTARNDITNLQNQINQITPVYSDMVFGRLIGTTVSANDVWTDISLTVDYVLGSDIVISNGTAPITTLAGGHFDLDFSIGVYSVIKHLTTIDIRVITSTNTIVDDTYELDVGTFVYHIKTYVEVPQGGWIKFQVKKSSTYEIVFGGSNAFKIKKLAQVSSIKEELNLSKELENTISNVEELNEKFKFNEIINDNNNFKIDFAATKSIENVDVKDQKINVEINSLDEKEEEIEEQIVSEVTESKLDSLSQEFLNKLDLDKDQIRKYILGRFE